MRIRKCVLLGVQCWTRLSSSTSTSTGVLKGRPALVTPVGYTRQPCAAPLQARNPHCGAARHRHRQRASSSSSSSLNSNSNSNSTVNSHSFHTLCDRLDNSSSPHLRTTDTKLWLSIHLAKLAASLSMNRGYAVRRRREPDQLPPDTSCGDWAICSEGVA